MPPMSKNYSNQTKLYSHFGGEKIRAVDAVLIYLKKYDVEVYNILVDRFCHKLKLRELVEKYNYDMRYLQRLIDSKVYRKLDEYIYVFTGLDNNRP